VDFFAASDLRCGRISSGDGIAAAGLGVDAGVAGGGLMLRDRDSLVITREIP